MSIWIMARLCCRRGADGTGIWACTQGYHQQQERPHEDDDKTRMILTMTDTTV